MQAIYLSQWTRQFGNPPMSTNVGHFPNMRILSVETIIFWRQFLLHRLNWRSWITWRPFFMFMPGVWILWSKKKLLLFFKKKMEILLHFLSFLQWKVFKKSKIAKLYYYDPQSAGINLQSPQSDSTPWTLTLGWIVAAGTIKEIFIFWKQAFH